MLLLLHHRAGVLAIKFWTFEIAQLLDRGLVLGLHPSGFAQVAGLGHERVLAGSAPNGSRSPLHLELVVKRSRFGARRRLGIGRHRRSASSGSSLVLVEADVLASFE